MTQTPDGDKSEPGLPSTPVTGKKWGIRLSIPHLVKTVTDTERYQMSSRHSYTSLHQDLVKQFSKLQVVFVSVEE